MTATIRIRCETAALVKRYVPADIITRNNDDGTVEMLTNAALMAKLVRCGERWGLLGDWDAVLRRIVASADRTTRVGLAGGQRWRVFPP